MQKESHVAVFCYTLPDINEATEMEVEESATQVGQSNQLSDPRKSTLIATFPSLEEAAKALLQIEYLHQLRKYDCEFDFFTLCIYILLNTLLTLFYAQS